MKQQAVHLRVCFLSYWHAGSGLGRGAELDALVLKDARGLPYLPGRTVKGLLREGMQCCEDVGVLPRGRTAEIFGVPTVKDAPDSSVPGRLFFSDARLPREDHEWLGGAEGADDRRALYDAFAATRIDSRGLAVDHTLRTIELCVPVELVATVSGAEGDWPADLQRACSLVRGAGSHRSRGLGRCEMTIQTGGHAHA
ncbi:MAG: hypothetical protein GX595_12085 [Lentisphaerae bacterium]|nr:hypothetical protein [Lentisphaerota bacterium]